MRTLVLSSILVVCTSALLACGDDGGVSDTGTTSDAASDAASDGGADASADATSDGAADASMDASADATSDAAADAASDAATDSATGDGGACSACIAAELAWGNIGGFVAFRRASTISPCRDYTLTQSNFSSPPSTMSCSNEVPCGDPTAVTMEDVNDALAHADVVAAFAAAPITYGRDLRPVDGTVFEVTQSGATFLVGAPCAGSGSCTPIPAGVMALVDLLRLLDMERLAEPDCSTVFP